ncbi:MAG: hypothetical protein KDK99_21985 [Verrucomicrobiales bacterium]|nr:hypothetical protein [Verrucomicrobiales bacterium]
MKLAPEKESAFWELWRDPRKDWRDRWQIAFWHFIRPEGALRRGMVRGVYGLVIVLPLLAMGWRWRGEDRWREYRAGRWIAQAQAAAAEEAPEAGLGILFQAYAQWPEQPAIRRALARGVSVWQPVLAEGFWENLRAVSPLTPEDWGLRALAATQMHRSDLALSCVRQAGTAESWGSDAWEAVARLRWAAGAAPQAADAWVEAVRRAPKKLRHYVQWVRRGVEEPQAGALNWGWQWVRARELAGEFPTTSVAEDLDALLLRMAPRFAPEWRDVCQTQIQRQSCPTPLQQLVLSLWDAPTPESAQQAWRQIWREHGGWAGLQQPTEAVRAALRLNWPQLALDWLDGAEADPAELAGLRVDGLMQAQRWAEALAFLEADSSLNDRAMQDLLTALVLVKQNAPGTAAAVESKLRAAYHRARAQDRPGVCRAAARVAREAGRPELAAAMLSEWVAEGRGGPGVGQEWVEASREAGGSVMPVVGLWQQQSGVGQDWDGMAGLGTYFRLLSGIELERAAMDAAGSIQMNPRDPQARLNHALALLRLGHFVGACQTLEVVPGSAWQPHQAAVAAGILATCGRRQEGRGLIARAEAASGLWEEEKAWLERAQSLVPGVSADWSTVAR